MPKWIKFFLVFMITLILVTPFSSSTARPLYASSATYPYYVGTSSAKAGSYATWVIEGQHRMKCTHSSWTSPATTINVLGFYWVVLLQMKLDKWAFKISYYLKRIPVLCKTAQEFDRFAVRLLSRACSSLRFLSAKISASRPSSLSLGVMYPMAL
jgi:hypothetical protein